MKLAERWNEKGAAGYVLLWLLGIPIPHFAPDFSLAWLHMNLGSK
jgi:hypothetical protein